MYKSYLMAKYSDGKNLNISERFKQARSDCGKNVPDIVNETGVSKNIIYQLENGGAGDVGYQKIVKLAKCYDVSLDWLLTGAGVPTANTTVNYICQYTGLSETSIHYLHSVVEECSGKRISAETSHLIEIEYKRIHRNIEAFRNGFITNSENRIETARKFGISDENDVDKITDALLDDWFNYERTRVIEESQARARLPVSALDAILSCENDYHILSDISRFLQLDSDFNDTDFREVKAENCNGSKFSIFVEPSVIAYGFLKKAESKLNDLRDKFINKYKIK